MRSLYKWNQVCTALFIESGDLVVIVSVILRRRKLFPWELPIPNQILYFTYTAWAAVDYVNLVQLFNNFFSRVYVRFFFNLSRHLTYECCLAKYY